MKRMTIVLLAAVICIFGWRAAADFDLKRWPLSSEVMIDPKPDKPVYIKIGLDGPVFDGARNDLADLRVIDQSGKEVPSHVVVEQERDTLNVRPVEMIDRVLAPDGRFSFVIDLGAEPVRHDRIILTTSAVNFSRRVRIETSSDNRNWAVTREDGYIYSFRSDSTVKYLGVEYPISTRRYLRVTIFNPPEPGEKLIEVTDAEVAIDAAPEPELIELPVASLKRSEDAKQRTTIFDLDLGFRNIPSTAIEIESEETNFHRRIEVEGRQQIESDPKLEPITWSAIGSGEIHRVSINGYKSSNLKIDYPESTLRYLKITFHHYDDRPIRIDGIKVLSLPRRLVFRAEPGNSYRLFYGNHSASRPRYDLERMIRFIDLGEAQKATLGPRQGRDRSVEPGEEKSGHPAWLIGVLIASAVVLLWLIFRLAKKTVA